MLTGSEFQPLRTRAIPERLRGVITTRRYTNPRLPLPLPLTFDPKTVNICSVGYWLSSDQILY